MKTFRGSTPAQHQLQGDMDYGWGKGSKRRECHLVFRFSFITNQRLSFNTVETAELHKFVTNFVGLLIYWDPCSMERVERA